MPVDPAVEPEGLVSLRIGVELLAKFPGRQGASSLKDLGRLRGLLDSDHVFVPWYFLTSSIDLSIRSIVFLASSNDSPEAIGPI